LLIPLSLVLILQGIHPGDGPLPRGSFKEKGFTVQTCFEHDVPIFCPAFSDSSAGFGLVKHQWERPDKHVSIDSVKDFLELTQIKMAAKTTGLFMIGGGYRKISSRIQLFALKS